jgi:hypothetical protein
MKTILKVYLRDQNKIEEYDLDEYNYVLEHGWLVVVKKYRMDQTHTSTIIYPECLVSKIEVIEVYETEPMKVYQ